jgi:hypothetical protein
MLLLFAALVSPVFAALHRQSFDAGRTFALRLFGGLVAGALTGSWLLYFIFG